MGEHLIDGEFQSDKYPTCPRGKVPLSCKDKAAQDLLWEYAQRRRSVDEDFSSDLERALRLAGYAPPQSTAVSPEIIVRAAEEAMHALLHVDAHMSERTEAAKAVADAIGHPWPPYTDDEMEDGDEP